MQSNQEESEYSSDDTVRLTAMKARLTNLNAVKLSVSKLTTVLGNLAIAEKKKQLSLLKQARAYLDRVTESKGRGLKNSLNVVANELSSLEEGLIAGVVKPKDLVLVSSVRVLKDLTLTTRKLQGAVERAEARLGISAENEDPALRILKNTKEIANNIPSLGDKDYAIARAPVAFTFAKKQQSSIGYVDTDKLKRQGFKVENFEGYTVIHNQMLVGVNNEALIKERSGEGDEAKIVPHTVIENVTKFHDGKPVQVKVKRPKTLADVAKEVVKEIENKTKVRYEMVSSLPARQGDGLWFWVAPTTDMRRLAMAFPGQHLAISTWGPFLPGQETTKREPRPIKKEAR
jgi:hypothetical protein